MFISLPHYKKQKQNWNRMYLNKNKLGNNFWKPIVLHFNLHYRHICVLRKCWVIHATAWIKPGYPCCCLYYPIITKKRQLTRWFKCEIPKSEIVYSSKAYSINLFYLFLFYFVIFFLWFFFRVGHWWPSTLKG